MRRKTPAGEQPKGHARARRQVNRSTAEPPAEAPGGAAEHAWVEVIKKMDDVYHELLDYEAALEQKNAALEESQQFIHSVLKSMSDVLVVCNRAGMIEDLNPSLAELTGCTQSELRGHSFLELLADPQSRRRFESHLMGHTGEPLADCEVQLRGAAGQTVPVTLSCMPRLSSARRPLGMVITGRPVGELRRAYSALRQAHEDLKRTQQQLLLSEKMASLGRLVAGVAHELNNPISFVLGNVVALRKYLKRIQEYLAAMHGKAPVTSLAATREKLRIDRVMADLPSLIDGTIEGAERTRDIVDSLKRFSAPGADEHEEVNLLAVIERAVQWVTKAAADTFVVSHQLPESIRVIGNAGQLQQVVMNLVQNAADATASARPGLLRIHARRSGADIVVVFADNGPGIAEADMVKIFDPFFTTKPVGKGTGLGLSISYGIVEHHGGHLSAANGSDGGAVFTLRLPLAPD
jgi:two-component system sensor histidine kinase HupT/HoxJ